MLYIYKHMTKQITEYTVQQLAKNYFLKKYRKKAKRKAIFADIEMRTKKQYGGKRADGLIAFRSWWRGEYVISFEAKSYKTIASMKAETDYLYLLINSLMGGLLVCVLSGCFFFIYKSDNIHEQFWMPTLAFLVGSILYAILTWNDYTHKGVAVIKQLEQYPGNEQWLAFSEDSILELKKDKWRQLKKIARNRGVGILMIRSNKKAKRIVLPKKKWGRNFLKYYAKEKEIRKVIA